MQPIQGIHHITAMASDPQRNAAFYHAVLGQRMIKRTVNFDDPGTYHLYYADEIGTPGTVLTFFPWPGARQGRPGNGEAAAVGYIIRPAALDYWRERLAAHGVQVTEAEPRFGEPVLSFFDPDGMLIELIATDDPATIQHWDDGPVPADYALHGFHSATLWVADASATARLLTGPMGYTHVGTEGSRSRFKGGSEDRGLYIDLVENAHRPRGTMGAGSVHHIAFRTRDDSEQAGYQRAIGATGLGVTPVRDRQYFRSIYFREPQGVLFEIATDAPGFLVDEDVADLGTTLRLPPWYEPQRDAIEAALPPLDVSAVIGAAGND